MEGSDVLPALLQKRNQEVDGHVDVLSEFFFREVNSTNGSTHTEDLLKLESDSGLDFLDLIFDLFVFTDGDGELTNLVQGVTHKLGDLLHEGFRSDQDIERLGPLLDELFILVELLSTFGIDATNIDLLGLVTVDGSTDETDLSVGGGDVGESDGTVETLILFGVVVSESDLEFDGFSELSLLFVVDHIGNSLLEGF